MKKIIILSLSVLLTGSMGFAQGHKGPNGKMKDPEKRAQKLTEWMKTNLSLTPEQQPKILAINLDAAKKMNALRADTSLSKENRHEKRKAVNKERMDALNKVLTADQQNLLKQKMKEKREQHKANMKAKKNNSMEELSEDDLDKLLTD